MSPAPRLVTTLPVFETCSSPRASFSLMLASDCAVRAASFPRATSAACARKLMLVRDMLGSSTTMMRVLYSSASAARYANDDHLRSPKPFSVDSVNALSASRQCAKQVCRCLRSPNSDGASWNGSVCHSLTVLDSSNSICSSIERRCCF